MTCAQGLLRLLWGGGPEVGVLRDWGGLTVLVNSRLQKQHLLSTKRSSPSFNFAGSIDAKRKKCEQNRFLFCKVNTFTAISGKKTFLKTAGCECYCLLKSSNQTNQTRYQISSV